MNNFLHMDLTMTNNCNFKCSYCFERENSDSNSITTETIKDFINFIRKLEKSEFLHNHYNGILINFWGGEPTLELEKIEYIINEFKNDNSICFWIFTNGSNEKLFDLVLKYKDISINNEPKVFTQISYDGDILHKKNRIYKSDKESLTSVKKMIYKFIDNNIPFTLKSTISLENIEFMWDSYNDFLKLNEYAQSKNYRQLLTYYPTIDYFIPGKLDIGYETKIKKLSDTLEKIARDCVKRKSYEIFKLFSEINVSECSAGRSLFCVDIDGKMYKCHGSLYSDNKSDHYINSINDENVVESLEENKHFNESKYREILSKKNSKCNSCFAVSCLRCNSMKYDLSKKDNYFDRWYDYDCQPLLCEVYKTISKYHIAVKNKLIKD